MHGVPRGAWRESDRVAWRDACSCTPEFRALVSERGAEAGGSFAEQHTALTVLYTSLGLTPSLPRALAPSPAPPAAAAAAAAA